MKFFLLNATHSGYCNRMGFQCVVGRKCVHVIVELPWSKKDFNTA